MHLEDEHLQQDQGQKEILQIRGDQEVIVIPKAEVTSSASSVPKGPIGKFLAESTRIAGPLAESPVDDPAELDTTGLPLEAPAPEGPTSAASPPDSSE